MAAAPVYEAYDEDDEAYLEGGEGEEYWVNDQVEAGEGEEEADEDDYGPGVTISWNKPLQNKPAPPVSDVPDEVYSDPMGLVNCWEEALVELKAAHPDRFLPPSDAPRSVSQRQLKAPLWHGPSTTPYPAPIASTSKLPSPSQPASSPALSLPPHMISTSYSTNPEPEPTKKRKRLTGSQKKARKAAKLANSGFSNGRAPAGKGSKAREEDGEEEQEEDNGSKSPEYRPQSPELAPQPEDADQAPPTQSILPTQSSSQPPQISPQPQPQPQQPLPAAKPFAAARLPLTFPAPPPITPLTGAEPALDPETPESLLESALWSWYTAGYQTALYHASVGVATFKQSENGEGEE